METNGKPSTQGLTAQVEKNLLALYERFLGEHGDSPEKAADDLMQVLDGIGKRVAQAAASGAERPATDADVTTPKGHVVIGRFGDTAVLFRPNSPYEPFVAAPGYDDADGSWHGSGTYCADPVEAWKAAKKTCGSLRPYIALSGKLDDDSCMHSVGAGIVACNGDGLEPGCWDLRTVTAENWIGTDYGDGIRCESAEPADGEPGLMQVTLEIDDFDGMRHRACSQQVSFLIDSEYVEWKAA